ncbi:MAG: TnpA family transposase [Thalassolituus sp.]|jgi:TnpA family transposase|nr:MAG: DDE transposase [Sphingopyxis sp.]
MTAKEQFLTNQQRYQPLMLPQRFSDEEMVRDWTLSRRDCQVVNKYRKQYRLGFAIQLCAMRLYGRFLNQLHDLSPRVISYLSSQLDHPPTLTVDVPEREATLLEHRNNILKYLGFQRFDDKVEADLDRWIEEHARQGLLPDELFHRAERYLLLNRIMLPGPSTIERQIIRICNQVHTQLFEQVFDQMSPVLRGAIDDLLQTTDGNQRTYFNQLKEYPPAAKISSLKRYLERYDNLVATGVNEFEEKVIDTAFLHYLYRLTKRYSAKDMKRFKDHKRYALMVCFLLESRKILLDNLVKMHDQYMTELCRQTRNSHDKKHKEFRKRQKKAIDAVLDTTHVFLEWPEEQPLYKNDLWQRIDEKHLLASIEDLHIFKRLEERGYCDLLLTRYPSLRKYFSDFIRLPFEMAKGSGPLIKAIQFVRQLDDGDLKKLPENTPTAFIPRELRRSLKDQTGNINRNVWKMGLALAMKDALRSGDLYLPQSKQHVSFWDLTLNEPNWDETKHTVYTELQQPLPHEVRSAISSQFHEAVSAAQKRFGLDNFAEIHNGRLKLKRDDKLDVPDKVNQLQKVIDAHMPSIRIEQLLMEVDQMTHYSRHFVPIQHHQSRPKNFHKSLLASYYPRYYGYYEKAIGIYTHVSDQYSVFSTKIISCSPREALYVLDGLLENNTILKIREHTTDTHGYTEIVFALCHLLGFYFMPRIRDLKDQQLYRIDKSVDYGDLNHLLTKTADLAIIEEQWEYMMRVVISLKQKTAPAHVIVQRLTNSSPSDRLTKAFTNLGRIIKTEYILRYLTDKDLRQTVQRQLNKGEYRHKLPRWIFFADQGEFTTGDYEEIMNKASSLSFVSNAILYWNTIKINDVVEQLRQQGEDIDDKTLSHISLLPYKHVLPNGTYFIEDEGKG